MSNRKTTRGRARQKGAAAKGAAPSNPAGKGKGARRAAPAAAPKRPPARAARKRPAAPVHSPPELLAAPETLLPPYPIVGIGASAGGLEAVTQLLQALPPSPGVALVLVQHLSPDHKSHLPDLLMPISPLPVVQAAEGV